MFEIHFIVFLDLINIYTDTKTIKIEAFTANLQAHPVFRAAILNFEFLAGKPRATIWFPLFFNSAYSKTPRCKFSCFYPEVHDIAEKCHISAPLEWTSEKETTRNKGKTSSWNTDRGSESNTGQN